MASGKTLKANPPPFRGLIVGYPKSGKTGSIAALLNVGYKVRVLDFENNWAPMVEFADERSLDNLDVVTLQDKMVSQQNNANWEIVPSGIPSAFNEGLKMMKSWTYTDPESGEKTDLGRSVEWGPDTVVVVDSMTALGEASMRRATKMMNKTAKTRTEAVWGNAAEDQVSFLQAMANERNKFHLVVLAHLQMLGPDDFVKTREDQKITEQKLEVIEQGLIPTRLFPIAVTKKLSQRIHKDFPIMLHAERIVRGGRTFRVLKTVAGAELDVAFPMKNAPKEVPIETGLADLFAALGHKAPGFAK